MKDELLPLERGPREALKIYSYRTLFFVASIALASIPLHMLILYSGYTHPSVYPVALLCLTLLIHLVVATGLVYGVWKWRKRFAS